MDGISIIMPAYNEGKRIEKTLENIITFFDKKPVDYEVIISIEGNDNTLGIVKKYAESRGNIRYAYSMRRLGKGKGIKNGFMMSKNKIVAFVDADNSSCPEDILGLIEKLKDDDAVIGSRALDKDCLLRPQGAFRMLVGKAFRAYVNLLFNLNISDTQCGYKAFKRKVLDDVLPLVKSNGFDFDVELLYEAKSAGFKVREAPIKWKDSDYSTIRFVDIFKMGFGVLMLRFRTFFRHLKRGRAETR